MAIMGIPQALKLIEGPIDALARLPQQELVAMAQRSPSLLKVLPIVLNEKAEEAQRTANMAALAQGTSPSVTEQNMAINAQAEAQPMMQQPMTPTDAGLASLPVEESNYAGGGIVAFDAGGEAYDDDDDDDDDEISYGDTKMDKENEALLMRLMAARESAPSMGAGILGTGIIPSEFRDVDSKTSVARDLGIRSTAPVSSDKRLEDSTPAITLSSAKEERSIGLKVPSGHKYENKIVSKAEQIGVDPQFALYIADKETGRLRNPETAKSRAGAMGIMQLMPGTAKDMGVKDPFDPDQNIEGGLRYAKLMMDKYKDPKIAAIAYNWGPGNTDKWLRSGADPDKLPRETRNYVASLREGGAIRFQNRGLVDDDIGFGPGRFMPNYTAADVTGSEYVMGVGDSETDFKKRIEALGAKLDAARLAVGKPPSIRELARDPTLSEKYKKSVENRNKLQKEYETLMETEGGLGKRVQMQSSPSGRKMVPVSNPVVKEAVKSAPMTARAAAATPLAQAASADERALQDQFVAQDIQEGGVGRLETPATQRMAAAAQAAAQNKTEQKPGVESLLETLLSNREKRNASQRQQDKYMAILTAGLGMLGGTSPYAFTNIGQGALQGVSAMLAANKQRAAEENAILSGRVAQYRIAQGEALRTQLAGEAQQTRLTQQLSTARQNMIKNVAAAKKMDLNSISDPKLLSTIEAQADAMLARDPAYQAIYKRIYGTDFSPTQMAAGPVDYYKNYGLTPGKK